MKRLLAYKNLPLLLVGRGIKALVPLAVVVLYTRKGQLAEVGEFGFAQSLALPAVLLFGLNLRRLVATDTGHTIWPQSAFGLRLTGLLLMLVTFAGLSLFFPLSGLVLLVLGLRSVEAFRDLSYGYFQLHDRQNIIGLSQVAEGVVSLAGVGVAFWLGLSLFQVCLWLVTTSLLALVCIDGVMLARMEIQRDYRSKDAMGFARLASMSVQATLPTVLCTLVGFIPNLVVKATLPAVALGTFVLIRTLIVPFDFVFEIFRSYSLTAEARRDAGQAKGHNDHDWRKVYFLCATAALGLIVVAIAIAGLLPRTAITAAITENRGVTFCCALAVYFRILVGYYQNVLFIRKMFRWQTILESVSPVLMLIAMYPLAIYWGLLGVSAGLAVNATIDFFLIRFVLSRYDRK